MPAATCLYLIMNLPNMEHFSYGLRFSSWSPAEHVPTHTRHVQRGAMSCVGERAGLRVEGEVDEGLRVLIEDTDAVGIHEKVARAYPTCAHTPSHRQGA